MAESLSMIPFVAVQILVALAILFVGILQLIEMRKKNKKQ